MDEIVRLGPVVMFKSCWRKAVESKPPSNPDPLEEPTSVPLIHTIVLPGPPLAVQVKVVVAALSSVVLRGLTRTLPRGDTVGREDWRVSLHN